MPDNHTNLPEKLSDFGQQTKEQIPYKGEPEKLEHEALKQAAEVTAEKESSNSESSTEQQERKENAQEKVEALAHSGKHELSKIDRERTENQPPETMYVNRELRKLNLQRSLKNIRVNLSGSQKALSRVVHQPIMDKVSEVGAKTFARPSGLLGGALVAFLGSSVILYIAKHYGYTYNLSFFFLLFIAGFLAGLFIELAWRLKRR